MKPTNPGYVVQDVAIYKEIWEAQNACNGRALLRSWANKWNDFIWNEVNINNGGTDAFNEHPLNIIMADKMLQLSGSHHMEDPRVQEAYSQVLSIMDSSTEPKKG